MTDVSVCKIQSEDNTTYFLYVKWEKDNSFCLKLLCNEDAWEGEVSLAELNKLRKHTVHGLEEYVTETKRALSTNGGAENFIYVVADGKFTWKKMHDGSTRVQFGSSKIREVPFTRVSQQVTEFLLHQNMELKETVQKLQEEKSVAERERNQLREELRKCVECKAEMEEELYSKFVAVLNAKKERILTLEELQDGEEPRTGRRVINKNKDKPQSSDEEDIYGGETEEDSDTDTDASRNPPKPKPTSDATKHKLEEHNAEAGSSDGVLKKRVRGVVKQSQQPVNSSRNTGRRAKQIDTDNNRGQVDTTQPLLDTQQLMDQL